jgi:hypothetical protein
MLYREAILDDAIIEDVKFYKHTSTCIGLARFDAITVSIGRESARGSSVRYLLCYARERSSPTRSTLLFTS